MNQVSNLISRVVAPKLGRVSGSHTKISSNWSSGISVSFEPWAFGTTSCTHGRHQLNNKLEHCRLKTDSMALAQWLNVKKSEDSLAFKELE